jgi:nucleotide-binding universal stress UspA family protein
VFRNILVPVDLADASYAKPAIANAASLANASDGKVRLLNVLPMTPVMLAEYVPADFDTQQRQSAEEALAIVAAESGIERSRISTVVRQGGIYHEILEEASAFKADLIVMTSHRPAMRTYFPRLQRRPRGALREVLGAGGEAVDRARGALPSTSSW